MEEEKVASGIELKLSGKRRDENILFKLPQVLQKHKQNFQEQILTSCLRICGGSNLASHVMKYSIWGFYLRN